MPQIWYFARDDQERGPFTETQMRKLVSAGKLRDDDLVWKEGDDDWVAASEASELLAARVESNVAVADSDDDAATRDALDVPVPPPEPPLPQEIIEARISALARESSRTARAIAYSLIAIGFLGVLASKGFESLTTRNVGRLEALVVLEESEFEKTWNDRIAALKTERNSLEESGASDGLTYGRLNQIESQIAQLMANRDSTRAELRLGEWRRRREYAKDASQHEKIWAFWRQLAFIGATTVFCAGLLVMGLIGETAERSISLLIMGVIAYSLFMGGAAWQ